MSLPATNVPTLGDLGAGHALGRYELLMPIASGGMAMVWAARLKGTRGFQKIVAIKTMLPKLSEDPQFEQMFLDEASLASQIRHPHVVEILDLGEQDGVLYLVMEWIDGVPLNQVIKSARKSGGVPLPVAVRICMQAAAGLHAAHEIKDRSGQLVGLVHRDVSPQNVLVTYDGVAKVVDFGVAKATAVGGGATNAGQIKGKVAYMAPEQIRGESIDRRIDVFALGSVLYLLTTGKHPFRKDSDGATMFNIAAQDPAVSPRRLVPSYPLALDRVVMQALAKDPAKRFATANDFLRALDQSLPASMRASTDEEVASFLRSVFSERREEQKSALQAALLRADTVAEDRSAHASLANDVRLRDLLDSQPPPSAASNSGVSAVLTGSHTPIEVTGGSVTPFDTTHASVSEISIQRPEFVTPKKRRIWPVFLALLVLGAGGTAAFFVLRTVKPVTPAASTELAPTTTASDTASAAEPPKIIETAPPPSAAPEPAPSATEAPPVASAKPVQKHFAPPKHGPATTPTAPNAPAWKQDPGF